MLEVIRGSQKNWDQRIPAAIKTPAGISVATALWAVGNRIRDGSQSRGYRVGAIDLNRPGLPINRFVENKNAPRCSGAF
jgi:hypothetical protein